MAFFNLKIITPQNVLVDKTIERVILRTTEGNMAVLANHAPLVAELAIGELTLKDESGNEENYFVAGGFLEVHNNIVTILADNAIVATDIDIEMAKREAEEAKAKLAKLKEEKDILLTERALTESLTKITIAEKHL